MSLSFVAETLVILLIPIFGWPFIKPAEINIYSVPMPL